jgi:hypothetical protein
MRKAKFLGPACALAGLVLLFCTAASAAAAPASPNGALQPPKAADVQAAPAAPSLTAPAAADDSASVAPKSKRAYRSLEDFLASLRGEKPQPATSCQEATRCYCDVHVVVRCSGSVCFKSTGCYVTCDDVEYDCPGCEYCA